MYTGICSTTLHITVVFFSECGCLSRLPFSKYNVPYTVLFSRAKLCQTPLAVVTFIIGAGGITITYVSTSVADPLLFDTDPDSAQNFSADPDLDPRY